jgi:Tfp pilus assembly protein PilX
MMKVPNRSGGVRREKGAVLAISMIFLIIVTLIAVYAANTATMDVRMARNMQAQAESAQAADAGVNAALETLAPVTGDVLFTTSFTPSTISMGTLLNNLNTGSGSVVVTINYMGKDGSPNLKAPTGQAGNQAKIACHLHRVISTHTTADATSSAGARIKQCIFE